MRQALTAAVFTAVLVAATIGAAAAQAPTGIPDLRGTWKGTSESIVLGGGNPHHAAAVTGPPAPRLSSMAFTLVIDKQDGRRISGTFSSARSSETVIAIVSRTGMIYMVDDDGYSAGTLLAPNRLELCYLHLSPATRVASCTELVKQP